jgi:hypothetical protein
MIAAAILYIKLPIFFIKIKNISSSLYQTFFVEKKMCDEFVIHKNWFKEDDFDVLWKNRIQKMSSYIDNEKPMRIVDFGCGMMWLEQYLNSFHIYVPVDYIKRDDRTIVVDLNVYPFPVIEGDIAFLSGILEYIVDIDKFYNEIVQNEYKMIVLSYCTLEKNNNINARHMLNWKSHLSIFTLIYIFTQDYVLSIIDDYNNNTILVFNRKII